MLSLSQAPTSRFFNQFDILLADTESLRQRAYQVRHRVFCEELGFAMRTSGGFETDEYDPHSLQVLLRDRLNDIDIASVRVVKPLTRGGGLPFESFGLRHIDRKIFDWKQLDPTKCCELSRLSVLQNVRRLHSQDTGASASGVKAISKDLRMLIPIALSYAALTLSVANNYEYIFMGGEPRLQRLITHYGIYSLQISPLFEYYGQRALFVLNRSQLLIDMRKWKPELLEFYRHIDGKLNSHYEEFAIARAS